MTEPRVIVRGVRKVEGLAPRPPLPRVPRQQVGPRRGDPYWMERGWTPQGRSRFTGWYWAGGARFAGRIDPDGREFLIRRPPEALRAHRHWICFRYRDNGWYAVHFATQPRDMSSGIMEIERILCEALGASVPRTPQRIVAPPPQVAVNGQQPHVIVSQPQTRREPHDDTRAADRITWDANAPSTVQQRVAQAIHTIVERAHTEKGSHVPITAGTFPWRWLFIALVILAFFALLV